MASIRRPRAGKQQRTRQIVFEHRRELNAPMTESAPIGFKDRQKDANNNCGRDFKSHRLLVATMACPRRSCSATSSGCEENRPANDERPAITPPRETGMIFARGGVST